MALREIQGPGKIRSGIQGIQEEHPPYYGFHISDTLNTADNFKPGGSGEGNKMKGISDVKIIPEERACNITNYITLEIAHTGGSVQNQYKIHGVLLGRYKRNGPKGKEEAKGCSFY
jgi:hypothetical protein